jgi:serine/threonine-protein kinase RsbW
MRAEKDLGFSQSVDPPDTVRFTLPSDLDAIRDGLQTLFALDLLAPLTEESRGAAEIVLAEVLNNVVEHAYAEFPGKIEIWVTRRENFLFIRIVDDGLPMPGGDLPGGKMVRIDDLPEGGFGWYLIRNLSHELTYQRDGKRNILGFCIGVDYQD